MSSKPDDPFFVGYLPTPAGLKLFLFGVSGLLIGIFVALALAIGAAQDNPGTSQSLDDWGPQTVTGILQAKPYPVLHVTKGNDRLPAGRSLLLTGDGKNGVQDRVDKFDGQLATLTGIAMKRGAIDALVISDDAENIKIVGKSNQKIAATPLGRWRIKGEICDGKCEAGAMRPGRGLSHRACANLCLVGGAPPVYVASAPVDGTDFMLMADKSGGPLPPAYLDYVALYIALDGEIERRGNILVFKVDFDTARVLK